MSISAEEAILIVIFVVIAIAAGYVILFTDVIEFGLQILREYGNMLANQWQY